MISLQSAHLKDVAAKHEESVLMQTLSFMDDGELYFVAGVCKGSGEPIGLLTAYKNANIKIWKNQTYITRLGMDTFEAGVEAITNIPLEVSSAAFINSFVELYELRSSEKDTNPQLERDRLDLIKRIDERLSALNAE